MRIEEEYSDVLHNIESAIVAVYDDKPGLVDRDVLKAIDKLIGAHEKEKRNRDGFTSAPSGRTRDVYEQCRRICEWQLGRQLLNEGERGNDDPRPGELSVAELISCLKRLRRSIRLWHKQGGRQGYLTYVRQFLSDASSR
jgi:hypothetical protein